MKLLRIFKINTQAPWRDQMRIASMILTVMVIISLIAGFYLSIAAQIAEAGIAIQLMDDQRNELKQQIADSQIKLAEITSANNMIARARKLGFDYATGTNGIYINVPGLQLPANSGQPAKRYSSPQESNLIVESYKQSLWDWIMLNIIQADIPLGGN